MAILLTAVPAATPAPLEPRSITLVPTATSGVAAPVDTTSHSHRPDPTKHLKSDKQGKAPVGLIVGVCIAVVVALFSLFFVRWLFVRRRTRRLDAARAASGPPMAKQPFPVPAPTPQNAGQQTQLPAAERDAVPLGHYPPSSAQGSWPTAFGADAAAPPAAGSSPAARQAYLAAELRAAQAQLERGGRDVNVARTKARIRELEERQQSAWALGLE